MRAPRHGIRRQLGQRGRTVGGIRVRGLAQWVRLGHIDRGDRLPHRHPRTDEGAGRGRHRQAQADLTGGAQRRAALGRHARGGDRVECDLAEQHVALAGDVGEVHLHRFDLVAQFGAGVRPQRVHVVHDVLGHHGASVDGLELARQHVDDRPGDKLPRQVARRAGHRPQRPLLQAPQGQLERGLRRHRPRRRLAAGDDPAGLRHAAFEPAQRVAGGQARVAAQAERHRRAGHTKAQHAVQERHEAIDMLRGMLAVGHRLPMRAHLLA
ncbi:hypothetical protein GRD98_06840 [Ralstonia solanacearum]|nr:hypothetical protein GRD98_06840 [Ralstonia solanacearum]